MSDPLDDLLRTPAGADDDPFHELVAEVPTAVAAALFAAARARCEAELAEARGRAGGDEEALLGFRLLLQRAIDAQAWVAAQPGETVTVAARPVDAAAEAAWAARIERELGEGDGDGSDDAVLAELDAAFRARTTAGAGGEDPGDGAGAGATVGEGGDDACEPAYEVVPPMSNPPAVKNTELVSRLIPSPEAPWAVLERFALTFPGYQWLPAGKCAAIADARRQGTLTELRACLFFEQRRWRHCGMAPEGEELEYVRDLVRQIRQRVELAERVLA